MTDAEEPQNLIFRKVTQADRERVGEDGKVDVWMNEDNKTDLDIQKTIDTETKLTQKNRQVLRQSTNPIESVKDLTCIGCFRREFQAGLINVDNIREIFEKYKARSAFDDLSRGEFLSKNKNLVEYSVTINLKRCPYCQHKMSYSFLKQELKPEVYELLINKSIELPQKDALD